MNTSAATKSVGTNPLEALMPRIKGAAHNIAWQRGTDPDDMEQDIILAILKRYVQEPEFLDQTAAYIVQYGAWRARRYVKKLDRMIEDGDAYTDVTGTNPWRGVDLRIDIQTVMAGLNERDQQIATSLAEGYTPREIGPAMGISYRTVYNRMHSMAGAMAL